MTSPPLRPSCEIINLNVGGTRFSTSRQTLTQVSRLDHLNHEPSSINFINIYEGPRHILHWPVEWTDTDVQR